MSEYQEHLPERLGELVVARRKELGWTQAKLAEEVDVTELTIRKIEHKQGNPHMDLLLPLLKALRISPSALLDDENDPKPAQKEVQMILNDCSNEEILDIIPVIEATKKILKKTQSK